MKRGIIIIGNGTITDLGVFRSLQLVNIPTFVISSDPNGCCLYSKKIRYKIFPDPKKFSVDYLNNLIDLSEEKYGDILIPTEDRSVEIISKNKELLSKYYLIPVPKWEVVKKCLYKEITYKVAKKINIPIPYTIKVNNIEDLKKLSTKIKYPCIIKSSIPKEREIIKTKAIEFHNKGDLIKIGKYLIKNNIYPLIQEKIPGPPTQLYTLGSVMDLNNNPIGIFCGRKIRQIPYDFGVSTLSESVHNPEVVELGLNLLNEIKYVGISQVEFKYDIRDKQYKLIEINPRPWLWILLSTYCGINLPYLVYKMMHKEKLYLYKHIIKLKWHDIPADIALLYQQIINKNKYFSFKDFLISLKGKRVFSTLTVHDFKPFLKNCGNYLRFWTQIIKKKL